LDKYESTSDSGVAISLTLAVVLGVIAVAGMSVGYGFAHLTGPSNTTTHTLTSSVTIFQTTSLTYTSTSTVVGVVSNKQHVDYYIHLVGVVGETSVLNYSGLIHLKAWDWGPPTSSCPPAGAAGGGPCATTETSLNFNATTSKASPTLQQDASQGTPISAGTLIGIASIGGQQTVVAKYDFTNLLVASYSINGQGNLPVDVVTLVFQKVAVVV
jgi:type VI secretion system secreted protein Hcp